MQTQNLLTAGAFGESVLHAECLTFRQGESSVMKLPIDVGERILGQLNIQERMRFGTTCKAMLLTVREFNMRTVLRIIEGLGFDGHYILNLLADTNSVIGGSAVLLVLNPWTFYPHDLDIFCPTGQIGTLLERLLCTGLVDRATAPGIIRRCFPRMENIKSIEILRRGRRQVNLFESTTSNPLEQMANFHSTVVMNYIACDHIYCAYPTVTFNYRNMVNMRCATSTKTVMFAQTIVKYVLRGYSFRTRIDEWTEGNAHTCFIDAACPATARRIADRYGVRIRLYNLGEQEARKKQWEAVAHNIIWSLYFN
ncbi:hypothetical protein C0992_010961 [Termitomyces sp. T32_za158]|nr:hypothetical protein C0992_010961 [Termitomyces sp. T32_za158]